MNDADIARIEQLITKLQNEVESIEKEIINLKKEIEKLENDESKYETALSKLSSVIEIEGQGGNSISQAGSELQNAYGGADSGSFSGSADSGVGIVAGVQGKLGEINTAITKKLEETKEKKDKCKNQLINLQKRKDGLEGEIRSLISQLQG